MILNRLNIVKDEIETTANLINAVLKEFSCKIKTGSLMQR